MTIKDILLLRVSDQLSITPYLPTVRNAVEQCKDTLLIAIELPHRQSNQLTQNEWRVANIEVLEGIIAPIYLTAWRTRETVNTVVVFTAFCGWDVYAEAYRTCFALDDGIRVSAREQVQLEAMTVDAGQATDLRAGKIEYDTVAVGGTFDHLHPGHKILLSTTAWLSSRRIICGVTDDALLQNKKYKQVLEPISNRIDNCVEFLKTVQAGRQYDVIAISDVYGPTAHDPNVQALVVSQETSKGGEAVNEERRRKGLPTLTAIVIHLVSDGSESEKMSSTSIRRRLME